MGCSQLQIRRKLNDVNFDKRFNSFSFKISLDQFHHPERNKPMYKMFKFNERVACPFMCLRMMTTSEALGNFFYFIAITQPWKQLLLWFRIQHLCYISLETTPSVAAWNRLSGSPVGPIGPRVRGLRPFDTSVPCTRAAPLSPKSVHAHTLRPLTQLKHCGGGPEVSQEVSCEGSVSELGDGLLLRLGTMLAPRFTTWHRCIVGRLWPYRSKAE